MSDKSESPTKEALKTAIDLLLKRMPEMSDSQLVRAVRTLYLIEKRENDHQLK